MLKMFKSKKGSVVLPSLAGALIIATMFLVISISAIAVMVQKQQLDTAATDVKRIIEVDGTYDSSEQQAVSNYLSKNHIQASVSCTASDRINLGESFTVTLSSTAMLGTGNMSIQVPIHGVATGKSEVYWK